MDIQNKNRKLLKKNHVYDETMEHDACGVGLVASTEGLKSRKVVEYGIEALKAVWHRGAIDADGKTGDGAGIHIEIPNDFFAEKIEITGHEHDNSDLCVGMIFLPTIIEIFFPKFIMISDAIQIMCIHIIPTSIAVIFESKLLGQLNSKYVLQY